MAPARRERAFLYLPQIASSGAVADGFDAIFSHLVSSKCLGNGLVDLCNRI
jgi:hypothetical protein